MDIMLASVPGIMIESGSGYEDQDHGIIVGSESDIMVGSKVGGSSSLKDQIRVRCSWI